MSDARVRIDVWSDYNCPWCFLASTSLEKLESSHPVEIHWHSYELRPKGSPPMPPEYKARIEEAQPRLVAMANETYGVEIEPKSSVFDSRPALIGAKYAEAQGVGPAYHRAVMRGYWQEGKQIEDRSVLADLAESLGLDRDEYLAALDDPAYDEQVQADIDMAQQYGLTGVPAIVFDMRYLIPGAQPHPVLADAVDQILAETNGDGPDEG